MFGHNNVTELESYLLCLRVFAALLIGVFVFTVFTPRKGGPFHV